MEMPENKKQIEETREAQPLYNPSSSMPKEADVESGDSNEEMQESGLELMSPEVRKAYLMSVERFRTVYERLAK